MTQEAQLAAARLEGGAVDADQVADVERREGVEGLGTEDIPLGVDLELAAAVDEIEEGRAAVAAPRRHAAGYAVVLVGLLAGLEVVVGGVDSCDRR